MTDYNQIQFIFTEASEQRANEMWDSARDDGYVSELQLKLAGSPYEDSDFWSSHRGIDWDGPLKGVRLRPSARKSPKEQQWAVPDMPYVEVLYEIKPLVDALIEDRDEEITAYVTAIQELVTYLLDAVEEPPVVAYSPSGSHLEQLAGNELPLPVTAADVEAGTISYTCWLMWFSPNLVETFGRDTLLSADVYALDERADGSILFVVYENPIKTGETQHIDQLLGLDPPDVDDDRLAY